MPYVSRNYATNPSAPLGQWVGSGGEHGGAGDADGEVDPYYGQCVSYVKAVTPGLPQTSRWRKGLQVKGNNVTAGTVIATFNAHGHYEGHAAIYESQSKDGINVIDQWITPPAMPIHRRMLRFRARGNSNNGDNFFVVE